jgi:dimethylglycine dehydrogenase
MATGARNMGAEIYRNTTVLSMKQTKDGWVV